MHDAERLAVVSEPLVRARQALQRFRRRVQRQRLWQRAGPRQHVAQVTPHHVLHLQVQHPLGAAEAEHLHHVRVIEPRRQPRLAEEQLLEAFLVERRQDQLERDGLRPALGPELLRAPHLAHAAPAHQAREAKRAEALAGLQDGHAVFR
jgi:hypothetical protein